MQTRTFLFVIYISLSLHLRGQVKLKVVGLPAATPAKTELYVMGDFNNWVPNDPKYRLTENSKSEFSITLQIPPATYAYKYTRGSNASTEGTRVDDRLKKPRLLRVEANQYQSIHDKIWGWVDSGGPQVKGQDLVFDAVEGNIPIKNWTVTDGLNQNLIKCLAQDPHGFIWVGTQKAGLNRFDGYEFISFKHHEDGFGITDNEILSLEADSSRNLLWIGTANGLNAMSLSSGEIKSFFDQKDTSMPVLEIRDIVIDKALIWLATDKGLYQLDPENRSYQSFLISPHDEDPIICNLLTCLELVNDDIYIGSEVGLNVYNKTTEKFTDLWSDETKDSHLTLNITHLYQDHNKTLWIGTYFGIFQLNKNEGEYHIEEWTEMPERWKRHPIHDIVEDKEGNFWLGFNVHYDYGEVPGVVQYNPHENTFKQFGRSNSLQSGGFVIYDILEDRQGLIWFATRAQGLNQLNPQKQAFRHYTQTQDRTFSLTSNNLFDVEIANDGTVWIGSLHGLNKWNPQLNSIQYYFYDLDEPNSLAVADIRSLLKDAQGNIWAGTPRGLHQYRSASNDFKIINPAQPGNYHREGIIHDIVEDSEGNIWFTMNPGEKGRLLKYIPKINAIQHFELPKMGKNASPLKFGALTIDKSNNQIYVGSSAGVWVFNPADTLFRSLPVDDPHEKLPDADINQIKWADSMLWISTKGNGLYRYACESHTIEKWLSSTNVGAFEMDNDGNVWFATNLGISVLNPSENTIKHYDQKDGIPMRWSLSGGSAKNINTGDLYFVSVDGGLLVFNPAEIPQNDHIPALSFTSLTFFDRGANEQSTTLQFIPDGSSIPLNHHRHSFTCTFSAHNYEQTADNQYAYKMDQDDGPWIPIGHRNYLTFSDLSYGDHHLFIKGSNNDGVWNEEGIQLHLEIIPPWWWSNGAKAIYIFLVLGIIYFVVATILARKEAKTKILLQDEEARRKAEMEQVKNRFYTNVTHEFRTPLTVIMGMNENITGHSKEKDLIRRNSQHLLHLVNELLDISKMETGRMTPSYIQSDLVIYLRYITESFYSLAREKNIRLVFDAEEDEVWTDFDPQKVQQIVYNLLSNAIRFTADQGQIIFSLKTFYTEKRLWTRWRIKDNGCGITTEDLPYIFDRFYQAESGRSEQIGGTGIGLAVTKQWVELMNGEIQVNSTLGKGTEFILKFPVTRNAPVHKIPMAGKVQESPTEPTYTGNSVSDPDAPQILIVEDNKDVVSYIVSILKYDYYLSVARNGEAGLNQATSELPDLIISDVMMPKMNGYDLCGKLKSDERTSHIPIILLTAKATQAEKISGLKVGADAYIIKPFDQDELRIRIEQLINTRKTLQQRYSSDNFYTNLKATGISEFPDREDNFVFRIKKIVEQHLQDETFSVDQFAKIANLTPTQLYRKTKALTDLTPNQFIRMVKLSKARELLENSDLTVSDIAYQVGFTDPNYFSRMFQKEFDCTPSTVRNRLNINEK